MSIRPIDLQTMFMRMNELSKEQSIAQTQASQKQALEDDLIAKTGKETDERVQQTEDIPNGPEHIDDKLSGNDPWAARKRKKRARNLDEPEPDKEKESDALRDPDLGNNIDISG